MFIDVSKYCDRQQCGRGEGRSYCSPGCNYCSRSSSNFHKMVTFFSTTPASNSHNANEWPPAVHSYIQSLVCSCIGVQLWWCVVCYYAVCVVVVCVSSLMSLMLCSRLENEGRPWGLWTHTHTHIVIQTQTHKTYTWTECSLLHWLYNYVMIILTYR